VEKTKKKKRKGILKKSLKRGGRRGMAGEKSKKKGKNQLREAGAIIRRRKKPSSQTVEKKNKKRTSRAVGKTTREDLPSATGSAPNTSFRGKKARLGIGPHKKRLRGGSKEKKTKRDSTRLEQKEVPGLKSNTGQNVK